LTRLTSGESANRVWFSRLDKTDAPANWQSAYEQAVSQGGCAGVGEPTGAHFARPAGAELARLHGGPRPLSEGSG
jgi:hypothetical protein